MRPSSCLGLFGAARAARARAAWLWPQSALASFWGLFRVGADLRAKTDERRAETIHTSRVTRDVAAAPSRRDAVPPRCRGLWRCPETVANALRHKTLEGTAVSLPRRCVCEDMCVLAPGSCSMAAGSRGGAAAVLILKAAACSKRFSLSRF